MDVKEKEDIKKWIKYWELAGIALKEVKKNELVSFNYAKNMELLDEMLQWAHENRTIRISSGLIDQQRLFVKLRYKNIK